LTTNNDRWLLTVIIVDCVAVVVDSWGSAIEPTAPMAASSTVVAVDGSGNDGIFATTYYADNRHPHPHHPCPCPPLDKEGTAG
jgi:hypothetical protein